MTPADRRWAHYYVSRVLTADDEAGRRDGWITRGDLVRWIDLLALGRAAVGRLDPEHSGQDVVGCEACALALAVARLREAARNAGFGASAERAEEPGS